MPVIEVHNPDRPLKAARARRRAISGIGILLVLFGLVVLAVTYAIVPATIYRLWPVILIVVGVVGLLRRPGWLQELDIAVPGVGAAAARPRRYFSWFLIGLGLVLLLFSLRLVDERVIGPGILIGLGLLFLWRRAR
jgi:hypothetical protein